MPIGMVRWLRLAVVLLAASCVAASVRAAVWIIVLDPEDAPPQGVRAVLMVNRGSTLRQREPVQRLLHALDEAGLLDRKAQAWSELALALGMDDKTAFDELLGRRAIAVFGASAKGGDETWALVSDALPVVIDQLEKKLDPAPRGVQDGQPVMLLERGRFQLMRVRACEKDPATHRLVLTPFDEPLPLAMAMEACPSKWAQSKADVLGYWRIKEPVDSARKPAAKSEPDRTVVVEATQIDQGWTANFSASAPLFGLTGAECKERSAGGRPIVKHDPNVLFAFEGVIPSDLGTGNEAELSSAKLALSFMKIPMPEAGLWGPGVVMRVERRPTGLRDVVVTIAVEVSDAVKSGVQGDALIGAVLGLSAPLAGANEQGAAQASMIKTEVERVKGDCEAMRLCTLEGQGSGGATLCWMTVVRRPYPVSGVPRGWWVVQFRPGAAAHDRTEAELRELGRQLINQPRTSKLLGIVMRPADIIAMVEPRHEAGAQTDIPWGQAFAALEQIEATAWAGASGRVEGEASVRITPVEANRRGK